ncbi:MAG: hypothetical protein PF503_21165 [Desulfobacula sp.]|jgi:hypothetical protein|nr:hypothetical protein [Desulfobacula sp.]
MKITDGMKIIEAGWVRKPKGFRVKYQKQTETGIEDGYSPPAETEPLTSDVTAWRYAWKLWQATLTEAKTSAPGAFYNITVVDDIDKPVRFYGTGDFETYSPVPIPGKDQQ